MEGREYYARPRDIRKNTKMTFYSESSLLLSLMLSLSMNLMLLATCFSKFSLIFAWRSLGYYCPRHSHPLQQFVELLHPKLLDSIENCLVNPIEGFWQNEMGIKLPPWSRIDLLRSRFYFNVLRVSISVHAGCAEMMEHVLLG